MNQFPPVQRDAIDQTALVRGTPLTDEPGLGALTLPGFIREVTTRFADREALVTHEPEGPPIRWSYEDLWKRSVAIARALIACGMGRHSRIGILMTNRPEWVSACFGISLAGGTVVGLSTFSTAAELAHLLKVSGISILLFERNIAHKDFRSVLTQLEPGIADAAPGTLTSLSFPFLRRLVVVDEAHTSGAIEGWEPFLGHGTHVPPELVDATASTIEPADPALLFFSSGSTGKPKGILNAHRGVSIQCWRYARNYALDSTVRTWSANGLFWSGNFALALGGTLAAGGALILQPVFVPSDALKLIQAERVTLPYCWPHQWAQLETEPGWDDADLSNFVQFDAERNLRRRQRSIRTNWIEPRASYGSTETFTISASYSVTTPREVWEGSFGEPLPGNTIKIVDRLTRRTLTRGETGEIAVKGPTLMLGYLGIPNDEVLDDEGFFLSGDGGYIDERGRLVFQGRINDIIKTGGANVSPVEVDWVLGSCPGVKVCKTVGIPHETLGEMVVSCIVRSPGSDITTEDVVRFLKERLASYKLPRKVFFVADSELSLTGTAKIKPSEARKLAALKLAEAGVRET